MWRACIFCITVHERQALADARTCVCVFFALNPYFRLSTSSTPSSVRAIYYLRPDFSLSPVRHSDPDPGSHFYGAGSCFSSLPTTVRASYFYRREDLQPLLLSPRRLASNYSLTYMTYRFVASSSCIQKLSDFLDHHNNLHTPYLRGTHTAGIFSRKKINLQPLRCLSSTFTNSE